MKNLILTILLLAGTPVAMLAHEGHGVHPSSNVLHYILEWVHGAPILFLAAALIITFAVYRYRSARAKKDA